MATLRIWYLAGRKFIPEGCGQAEVAEKVAAGGRHHILPFRQTSQQVQAHWALQGLQ